MLTPTLTPTYLRGIPFLHNGHSAHTLEEPKYKFGSIKSWQKSICHTRCKGISLQERRNASSLVCSNLAYSSTCLSWYWPPDLGSLSNIQSKYCEILYQIMQDKTKINDVMSNKQCTKARRIGVLWMHIIVTTVSEPAKVHSILQNGLCGHTRITPDASPRK